MICFQRYFIGEHGCFSFLPFLITDPKPLHNFKVYISSVLRCKIITLEDYTYADKVTMQVIYVTL